MKCHEAHADNINNYERRPGFHAQLKTEERFTISCMCTLLHHRIKIILDLVLHFDLLHVLS
jgi:hypothetical protein